MINDIERFFVEKKEGESVMIDKGNWLSFERAFVEWSCPLQSARN